jgi:cell division septal protein FtsQ
MKRAGLPEPGQFLRRGGNERISRNRRRRSLRRRLLLLAGLFACGLAGGTVYAARQYLTHAPRFRVRRIDFSETRHARTEDLARALAGYRGRNLFLLDLDRVAGDLASCHWVRRAVVKRVLPDRLFCAVEERVPRGLALIRGRVWLVDDEGTAIDPYGEGTRGYSFPILTGVDDRDAARARERIVRGVALVSWLQATHPELLPEISEIDLGRDDRLEVRLNEGGPAIRLHPTDFGTNLDRFLTMRGYLATHFGDGAYVDLRFKDRLAFQPLLTRKD